MSGQSPNTGDPLINPSLMGLIRVCNRWRNLIIFLVLALTLSTAVIMLFTPNTYTATGTLLLEMTQGDMSLELLGEFGTLAGLRTGATSEQIYMAMLNSRQINQAVIDSLDLANHYQIKGPTQGVINEVALHHLKRFTNFTCPDGIVLHIVARDQKPAMAASICNVFIDRLIRANQSFATSRSHRTRKMLEGTLLETEAELNTTRRKLGQFQTEFGVFALDEQTLGTLDLIAGLQEQLLEVQTRRNTLAGVKREGAADVRALDLNITAIQRQIDSLTGKMDGQQNRGFVLPLGNIPDLSGDYARIMMDLTVLESKYLILTSQLEAAKLDESQSAPTFDILDQARVPQKKTGPNRTMFVFIAFISSLLAGILLAVLLSDISQRFDADTQAELMAMLPAPLARRFGKSQHQNR
jgi:uncharacterized protein involved in exopolysaccharide biosynthesis